jgi:hypothetical protein
MTESHRRATLKGAELEYAMHDDEIRRIAEALTPKPKPLSIAHALVTKHARHAHPEGQKPYDLAGLVRYHMNRLDERLAKGESLLDSIKVTLREAVLDARAK